MSEHANRLRGAAIARAVRGPGLSTADARLAAFANTDVDRRISALIDKVARNAWRVTDDDVDAAKRAGLAEDEIFELVVCAAFGQSSRQLTSARSALDAAARAPQGERS
jgi:hypothetical protein